MNDIVKIIAGGLASGSILSVIVSYLLHRRFKTVEADLQKAIEIFRSGLDWKERSLSVLLGPIYIQLDRTKRAYNRYKNGDVPHPERQVLRDGNQTVQQLLLTNGHLIPKELLADASTLL